jgi:hypothetical protein
MFNSIQGKDPSQAATEKAKVLKKLMAKWFNAKDTRGKADMLHAKNPHIRVPGLSRRGHDNK